MALRGQQPKVEDKRLKMLLYGKSGVGKTFACTQMRNVYLIDTERGAQNDEYVRNIEASDGAYLFITTFDELLAEVMELLKTTHDYRTLVIDPMTVIYSDMIDSSTKKIAKLEKKDEDDDKVTAFGRANKTPDRHMKHLLSLLTKLDMNVIVTSHAKDTMDGDVTYDCYKKIDYLFDLVLELQKRGKDRYAVVKKTRIAGFPDGDSFKWSYDELVDRYGREHLERRSNVVLASAEQVARVNELLAMQLVPKSTVENWLAKGEAETIEEMRAEHIAKCINYLEVQLKKVSEHNAVSA